MLWGYIVAIVIGSHDLNSNYTPDLNISWLSGGFFSVSVAFPEEATVLEQVNAMLVVSLVGLIWNF